MCVYVLCVFVCVRMYSVCLWEIDCIECVCGLECGVCVCVLCVFVGDRLYCVCLWVRVYFVCLCIVCVCGR